MVGTVGFRSGFLKKLRRISTDQVHTLYVSELVKYFKNIE